MYKTIFVINIAIYMFLQHSNVLLILNGFLPILRERICCLKEFTPLRILSLLPKEFAPLRIFCKLMFTKQVVYSFYNFIEGIECS